MALLSRLQEEKGIIEKWVKESETNANVAAPDGCFGSEAKEKKPIKIIFDTDIGTDVDDALALLMTLNLPKEDVEILGLPYYN
jgi:hypothetical protein